jgi:hypothetical protein
LSCFPLHAVVYSGKLFAVWSGLAGVRKWRREGASVFERQAEQELT